MATIATTQRRANTATVTEVQTHRYTHTLHVYDGGTYDASSGAVLREATYEELYRQILADYTTTTTYTRDVTQYFDEVVLIHLNDGEVESELEFLQQGLKDQLNTKSDATSLAELLATAEQDRESLSLELEALDKLHDRLRAWNNQIAFVETQTELDALAELDATEVIELENGTSEVFGLRMIVTANDLKVPEALAEKTISLAELEARAEATLMEQAAGIDLSQAEINVTLESLDQSMEQAEAIDLGQSEFISNAVNDSLRESINIDEISLIEQALVNNESLDGLNLETALSELEAVNIRPLAEELELGTESLDLGEQHIEALERERRDELELTIEQNQKITSLSEASFSGLTFNLAEKQQEELEVGSTLEELLGSQDELQTTSEKQEVQASQETETSEIDLELESTLVEDTKIAVNKKRRTGSILIQGEKAPQGILLKQQDDEATKASLAA